LTIWPKNVQSIIIKHSAVLIVKQKSRLNIKSVKNCQKCSSNNFVFPIFSIQIICGFLSIIIFSHFFWRDPSSVCTTFVILHWEKLFSEKFEITSAGGIKFHLCSESQSKITLTHEWQLDRQNNVTRNSNLDTWKKWRQSNNITRKSQCS